MQSFCRRLICQTIEFLAKKAPTPSCMMPLLYFHRHSGVLWSHAVEHAEELWAEAGGGQPHGRAVGEECFPTKVWTCTFYLPRGGGESVGADKKKQTLQQPRMVHACVVSAQAIQKVQRLKAQVETFFIARSSTHSSMTQQSMCLIVEGGQHRVVLVEEGPRLNWHLSHR